MEVIISLIYDKIRFLDLKIERTEKYNIMLKDSIILLLGANQDSPIETRTVLYKELFLFYDEILSNPEVKKYFNVVDPEFVPYIYGPFSFKMASDLGELIYDEVVSREGKKNNEKFRITDFGISIYNKLKDKISSTQISDLLIDKLKDKRIGWDQLGRRGLVNRIKDMYPKYFLFGTTTPMKTVKTIIKQSDISLEGSKELSLEETKKAKKAYTEYEDKYEGLMWAQLYHE